MYQKVPSDMDFVRREKEILSFWKDHQIFEKSGKQNKGKEPVHVFMMARRQRTANRISAIY